MHACCPSSKGKGEGRSVLNKRRRRTTRTAQGIVVRLNLQVGPLVRSTLFHVADILQSKMLLEWPWIHANLVVASSYHISIQFPMNGWCLYLDSDPVNPSFIRRSVPSPRSCIDPRPFLVSFGGYPTWNSRWGFQTSSRPRWYFRKRWAWAQAQLLRLGYHPGLGLAEDGICYPMSLPTLLGTFGLGFDAPSTRKRCVKKNTVQAES